MSGCDHRNFIALLGKSAAAPRRGYFIESIWENCNERQSGMLV